MENCVFNKDIKIPQNSSSYFIIKKDPNWLYSIRISIKLTEEIDYLNLFFIFQSYIYTNTCVSYALGTMLKDINSSLIITQNESISKIRKMSFENFQSWVNFRISNDWKYNKETEFYSFIIKFEKNIIILRNIEKKIDVLDYLRPNYPWNKKWLDFFEKSIEYVKLLEKKIIYLENLLQQKTENLPAIIYPHMKNEVILYQNNLTKGKNKNIPAIIYSFMKTEVIIFKDKSIFIQNKKINFFQKFLNFFKF